MSDQMSQLALKRLEPRALELYHQEMKLRPQREQYRQYFLSRYGPKILQGFSDEELLLNVPQNAKTSGMDYTLEFKNDEEFNQAFFGSISGSYSKPYGVFRRKATGKWWTKEADPATPEQALAVVKSRVREISAACEFLDTLDGTPVQDIEPEEFQERLQELAPTWYRTSWLHKYLHLYCPRLISWNHAKKHLEAELYRLGQRAFYNYARYANDILALRFWSRILDEPMLDVTPHWEKGPRKYWSYQLDSEGQVNEIIKKGSLGLFVPGLGDLSEAYQFSGINEIEKAVKAELDSLSLEADLNTLKNFGFMKPGELITLVHNKKTVRGVGELEAPGYEYKPSEEEPHQRRVRWLHDQPFELDAPADDGLSRISLKRHGLNVPLIERSLMAYAGGEWPKYEPNRTPPLPPPPDWSTDPMILEILELLKKKGQAILYGPPGTGKTYYAEKAALELVAQKNFGSPLSSLQKKQAFQAFDGSDVPFVSTCTFHPAYAYEDFIDGYRPTGDGGFELRDGTFKRVALAAKQDPDKAYVLLIDEINRGNIPKVLGELITLLEYNKRNRLSVILPVSGETFTVPRNLYIIATMNTADRSILLLDTALRRRFGFMELMPQPERLQGSALERPNLPLWLAAVNRRIVSALGRDGRNLQVGHAYLMEDGKPLQTLDQFANALRQELWPLLQEYCYEDAQALTAILGKAPKGLYDPETDDLARNLFRPENRALLVDALVALIEPEDKQDPTFTDEPEDDDDGRATADYSSSYSSGTF
jgi:5-methylcytosine-specific restriction enzyme B